MKVERSEPFRVEQVNLRKLDSDSIKTLYGLTHGSSGTLAYLLKSHLEGNSRIFTKVKSFIVRDEEAIKGWSMTFNVGEQRIIQMYVNSDYRDNGIGTALAHKAKTLYPDIKGHNDTKVYARLGLQDISCGSRDADYTDKVYYAVLLKFGDFPEWGRQE